MKSLSSKLSSSKVLSKTGIRNSFTASTLVTQKKLTNFNRMQRRSMQRMLETTKNQSAFSIRKSTSSVLNSHPTQQSFHNDKGNINCNSTLSFYKRSPLNIDRTIDAKK